MIVLQRGRKTTHIKAQVRERDGMRCVDCEAGPASDLDDNPDVHRLVPGSQYAVDACVTLCEKCHNKRHAHLPRLPGMRDKLMVTLMPELKSLVVAEAERTGIHGGMGELVVRILAEYFKRPELGRVPRKKMGRPPNVHPNGNGHTNTNGHKPEKRPKAERIGA